MINNKPPMGVINPIVLASNGRTEFKERKKMDPENNNIPTIKSQNTAFVVFDGKPGIIPKIKIPKP